VGLAAPLRASFGSQPFGSDARGGTVTRQWLTRGWLAAALAQHRPTVVLVSSGTNDAAGQITAETFAATVREVNELAAKSGARVVWLAPPPMPYATAQIRAGLAAAGVPAIEPPADLERAPDKIHCTPRGYAQWAARVRESLR
jgi:lysophospholipase L1-like esterase